MDSQKNTSLILEAPMINLHHIDELKPHEQVDVRHVQHIATLLLNANGQLNPVIIDRKTKVLIDGHHRLEALRLLKIQRIAVIAIDYLNDDHVKLDFWRSDVALTKQEVLNAGLRGALLNIKTTKHTLLVPVSLKKFSLSELQG